MTGITYCSSIDDLDSFQAKLVLAKVAIVHIASMAVIVDQSTTNARLVVTQLTIDHRVAKIAVNFLALDANIKTQVVLALSADGSYTTVASSHLQPKIISCSANHVIINKINLAKQTTSLSCTQKSIVFRQKSLECARCVGEPSLRKLQVFQRTITVQNAIQDWKNCLLAYSLHTSCGVW